MKKRTWIWIAIGAGAVCIVGASCCCFSGVLGTLGGSAPLPPSVEAERAPEAAAPEPTPAATPAEPAAAATAEQARFMACPTLQIPPRDPPPLLPAWMPEDLSRRLLRPFPPVPFVLGGSPAALEVVRDERTHATGLRVDRWVDGSPETGTETPLPRSARRTLSGTFRDADAVAREDGHVGVALHSESVVAFAIVDTSGPRIVRTTRLPLPSRGGDRPGRPRVAHGGGVYGVVVPSGFELIWFELDSRGEIERGPIALDGRSNHPRVVWNGERFAVLASPEHEGDHTLALYEIAPGGSAPSRWRTLARSYDPSRPFEQRRYVVRGELLFEQDAYHLLVSSWSTSHRSPDHRFELFRAGLDGSVERRPCADPTRLP